MKSRLQKTLTNPISHAMGHRNLITRLQKTLTNPISHAMGHKIYETKAAKPLTKPISHVCQGAQNYDINAAKNTDKTHFT